MERRTIRRGIMITVALLFNLLIAKAVMADTVKGSVTPWYAAWYLWAGLGIFIIVIVSIAGEGKNPNDSR